MAGHLPYKHKTELILFNFNFNAVESLTIYECQSFMSLFTMQNLQRVFPWFQSVTGTGRANYFFSLLAQNLLITTIQLYLFLNMFTNILKSVDRELFTV